jgi:hypothetical protein
MMLSRQLKGIEMNIEVKCDYCLKMRPEEKTLELDDGTIICVLCLAGEVEVEHNGSEQEPKTS